MNVTAAFPDIQTIPGDGLEVDPHASSASLGMLSAARTSYKQPINAAHECAAAGFDTTEQGKSS